MADRIDTKEEVLKLARDRNPKLVEGGLTYNLQDDPSKGRGVYVVGGDMKGKTLDANAPVYDQARTIRILPGTSNVNVRSDIASVAHLDGKNTTIQLGLSVTKDGTLGDTVFLGGTQNTARGADAPTHYYFMGGSKNTAVGGQKNDKFEIDSKASDVVIDGGGGHDKAIINATKGKKEDTYKLVKDKEGDGITVFQGDKKIASLKGVEQLEFVRGFKQAVTYDKRTYQVDKTGVSTLNLAALKEQMTQAGVTETTIKLGNDAKLEGQLVNHASVRERNGEVLR